MIVSLVIKIIKEISNENRTCQNAINKKSIKLHVGSNSWHVLLESRTQNQFNNVGFHEINNAHFRLLSIAFHHWQPELFFFSGSNVVSWMWLAPRPLTTLDQARGVWKHRFRTSFISPVLPTVYTNLSWKRSFWKTVFSNRRNMKTRALRSRSTSG